MEIKVSIASALDRYRTVLDDEYKNRVIKYYNLIKEKYKSGMNKAVNDWDYAKIYMSLVRPNFKDKTNELDEDKLQRNGDAYAKATLMQWEEKIKAKLEDLDEAELKHLNDYSFELIGFRKGKKVVISQNMIINVSPKGLVFNQFPAKIYVEGKFTSEAKYKEMFK